MPADPTAAHEHNWRDTGFADLDECDCGATRSAATGIVSSPTAPQRAVDASDMELLAWVGPDEFNGTRGIKRAMTPVGFIPIVVKGEDEHKIHGDIRGQLQQQAMKYGTRIQLVRFRFVEVVDTLEPDD